MVRPDYGWKGDYKSWEDAVTHSSGYDTANIFKTVASAMLAVKRGEAEYERDGVLFDKMEYSWQLVSAIFIASSASKKNSVTVLDFGGGLGSSFYQNRKFLAMLNGVKWAVLEQKDFVRIGKEQFEDEHLKFYESLDDACTENKPDLLVLASVLQYLENPYDVLTSLLDNGIKFVIVDRTIVRQDVSDRICIQKVPGKIYKASYPCRIFSEKNLLDFFESKNYKLLEKYDSLGWRTSEFEFNGYIFWSGT